MKDFKQSFSGEPVEANAAFLAQLREKLPEFFTSDDSFDLEKFKSNLDKHNINEFKDGYTLNYVGKNYARIKTGEPTKTVIVPDVIHNGQDVNKDSQNVFLTGDNLDVLKHLQKAYTNSVDFIYIDPPYNTGSDGFVYKDKFNLSDEDMRDSFGMTDDEINRLKMLDKRSSHSAWLTFMYPRLKIAQQLLTDTGAIFVSIDENEQANLKLLMDDIFGESQYVASAPRKTGAGSAATRSDSQLRKLNDYIFIYAKDEFKFSKKVMGEKNYPFSDEFGEYTLGQFQATGSDATKTARPNMWYPIYRLPDNTLTTLERSDAVEIIYPSLVNGVEGRWMWKPETFEKDNDKYINYNDGKLSRKIYYDSSQDQTIYQVEKAWFENFPNNKGTKHVNDLMEIKGLFSNPKPVELIKFLINLVPNHNITVLDFFGGSGTTAEAVLQANSEDHGDRNFILATLDEETNSESAQKSGYTTIDQISRERIKRAGEKIKVDNPLTTHNLDIGFKHYYVKEINTTNIIGKMKKFDDNVMEVEDIVSDFSSEQVVLNDGSTPNTGTSGVDTILQTWLISDGFKFDVNTNKLFLSNKNVSYVEEGAVVYIIEPIDQTDVQELLNKIGNLELNVKTIVVFGYSLTFATMTALKNNVKTNLEGVTVEVRY